MPTIKWTLPDLPGYCGVVDVMKQHMSSLSHVTGHTTPSHIISGIIVPPLVPQTFKHGTLTALSWSQELLTGSKICRLWCHFLHKMWNFRPLSMLREKQSIL